MLLRRVNVRLAVHDACGIRHDDWGLKSWLSRVFFLALTARWQQLGRSNIWRNAAEEKKTGAKVVYFFPSYAEKQPTQVGNLTGNALEEKLSREEVGKILDNAGHHIPYFHWIKWCSMHIFAQDGFAREMGYKNYSHWATWRVHKLTWHLNQEGEGTLSQTAPTPQAARPCTVARVRSALHRAGITMQSGTLPVERHWAFYHSALPAATKQIGEKSFKLLSSLTFIR